MYEERKYRPISAWGYFGYGLLFSIPVVGFIMAIVFSFNNKNINRRNFARSYFCGLILAVVLAAALVAIKLFLPAVYGVAVKWTKIISDLF